MKLLRSHTDVVNLGSLPPTSEAPLLKTYWVLEANPHSLLKSPMIDGMTGTYQELLDAQARRG